MKRNRKVRKPGDPPRWRMKKGVGAHYMRDGTEVVPGAEIAAWPEELRGVLDKFAPLDPIESNGPPTPVATLIPVHIKDDEWDVRDQNGNSVTDRPLSAEEAQSLVNGDTPPDSPPPPPPPDDATDIIREIMKDMILTEKNLTKTGRPELPELRERVHRIDPNLEVTSIIRDKIFEELAGE